MTTQELHGEIEAAFMALRELQEDHNLVADPADAERCARIRLALTSWADEAGYYDSEAAE